jgi:hypothetical protein
MSAEDTDARGGRPTLADLEQALHDRDAALDQARVEAQRYRDAYEILGGAFTQTAARLHGETIRKIALENARLVRVYGPGDLICQDHWLKAGASVEQRQSGAVITTPAIAWHYAAGAPLDYSGIDFQREDAWVRVRLGGVDGQLGAALYDEDSNEIFAHEMFEAARGVREAILPVGPASARFLLFRAGQDDAAVSATFVGAEIVVAAKPPPEPPAADPGPAAGETPSLPRRWRDSPPMRAAGRAGAMTRGGLLRFGLRLIEACEPAVRRHGGVLDRAVLAPLVKAAAWWRSHVGTPRTLWGVTPILTLPLLARADRLLGLRSSSVVYTTYATTSAFEVNLKRLMHWIEENRPHWRDPLEHLVLRLCLLRFDVFNYFCDRGLSPQKHLGLNEPELQLLRRSGHRLYAYAYGADVRTRGRTLSLGVHNLCVACPAPGQLCICDDDRGARNQQMIAQYAAAVVVMGDMLAYGPPGARNQPYWPLDTGKIRYVGVDWTPQRPLRVAHAPNHPYFKGTHHLTAAIERLRSEGRAIELIRIQGVPNSEVVRLFEQSDLIADQFVAGSHGYTALEGMAAGKPVLCYLRDPSMVLDPDVCPMINTWPESVYQTLKDCLDGRYDLAELGRRSRAYIEHHYSIEAVALRLGGMYLETADFPERINRRIRARMDNLIRSLPPLIEGQPPVPWSAVPGSHIRPAWAA